MSTIKNAAENETAVTVTLKGGKTFTGVPVATDEEGVYRLRTGVRGRPPVLREDRVLEVTTAA